MIIPKRDAKSYGAVHIDYFLTFVGFCKKVYSDEIQSIDVLIDGNKIDTIVCDKTIDKLSQIYDIEGHGFEYDLPEVYFDKRHLLSFRCSGSGEELVNSPISTICKDDEKFNEYKFLNSLSKPIDEDKIKDMYCPNSIGFLATKENLADEEFVEYINQIMNDFPNYNFKAFYFNEVIVKCHIEKFTRKDLQFVALDNIVNFAQNIEAYLSNYQKPLKNNIEVSIVSFLRYKSDEVAVIDLSLHKDKDLTISDYEEQNKQYVQKLLSNIEYLGFDLEDVAKYGNSYHKIQFKKAEQKYNVDIKFNLNDSLRTAQSYYHLKLGYQNHEYFRETISRVRKIIEIQK